MSIVYLNGVYLPMAEARISPMDRGFLFGDGIYEVIPSYDGQPGGLHSPHGAHAGRARRHRNPPAGGSGGVAGHLPPSLIARNGGGNLGIYIHVSRGADIRRNHAYPEDISPTIYAFAFEIPPPPVADKSAATLYTVATTEDLRWKRCNIKSTALLGNVMHYQYGHALGHQETILYNQDGELTEAAACNVFVVRNGIVATPLLDHQKLPGITRLMLLEILRRDGSIPVQERVVTMRELAQADEVWLTSSSKEIAPVVEIDGRPVGDGRLGDVWLAAQTLFSAHKFDF